jgi:hypothetical protein
MQIGDEPQRCQGELHVKLGPALIVRRTRGWHSVHELPDLIPLIVLNFKAIDLRILQFEEQRLRLTRGGAIATPERGMSRTGIHALQCL